MQEAFAKTSDIISSTQEKWLDRLQFEQFTAHFQAEYRTSANGENIYLSSTGPQKVLINQISILKNAQLEEFVEIINILSEEQLQILASMKKVLTERVKNLHTTEVVFTENALERVGNQEGLAISIQEQKLKVLQRLLSSLSEVGIQTK